MGSPCPPKRSSGVDEKTDESPLGKHKALEPVDVSPPRANLVPATLPPAATPSIGVQASAPHGIGSLDISLAVAIGRAPGSRSMFKAPRVGTFRDTPALKSSSATLPPPSVTTAHSRRADQARRCCASGRHGRRSLSASAAAILRGHLSTTRRSAKAVPAAARGPERKGVQGTPRRVRAEQATEDGFVHAERERRAARPP
eukprot:2647660-Prymnesium_polylepis.1